MKDQKTHQVPQDGFYRSVLHNVNYVFVVLDGRISAFGPLCSWPEGLYREDFDEYYGLPQIPSEFMNLFFRGE